MPTHHLLRFVIGLVLAAQAGLAMPAGAIVIGQSLPLTGSGFPVANRVLAGAKAYVERFNASGGLQGRPLELVTLDDGGDPGRHAANLRSLARQHRAVAVLNCLGESACQAAAEATRELRLPLVGPMSGALALRSPTLPQVFSLRPDDARETGALAQQLQSIGITRALLLSDGAEPARGAALAQALERSGIRLQRTTVDGTADAIAGALQRMVPGAQQALVIHLGLNGQDALGRLDASQFTGVPGTIATLSSAGLTHMTRLFPGRLIGYTSVVPNPETPQLPVVREFLRDADAFIGPEAVTFEGLEAYLNLRLLAEALRRAGPSADSARLAQSLEALGAFDMGGFRLRFGPDQHHGSEFVEVGLRARDGRLLR
ncbi:ABC transporter substrate-binding protein [Hydrogenophaga taeniospiralis]|uniref:ABC transporter substrate-binding protein n=1 Tax=Hydrogenophaga taeniospiralis TaxID=65656 RepID=UPI001CF9397F|nr:ABC transporter substrate-binding protein [Hydrogenophaga taeniospiralis]MCB4366875.1 ABC transporter substrate-binding protein [Hydrogenophaga taeniospiralis]